MRAYDGEWARGLAFGYGEWHQATIDFGHQVTFDRIIQWYHGGMNNNEAVDYKLQYWSGSNWVDIFETNNSHAYLKYPDALESDWWYYWSTPYENTFAPVTSDKIKILNFPRDGSHTWLYEVEVYYIAPASPQNLVATAGNTQVELKWNKNSESDITKYRIYYGTISPASTLKDSTCSVLDTLKLITDLTNGMIYYFRVTAVDSAGNESGFSNEVNATPIVSPNINMNCPSIVSVKDVPYDQGGRVSLVWFASALDTNVNILPSYSIWRSSPELLQSDNSFKSIQEQSKSFITNIRTMVVNGIIYSWECIGTQPAHRFSSYSFTATTLYDSMSTTIGKHYFMVSALTNDPNVFYDSKIDSGFSVDNLPPLPPQNLAGNIQPGKIVLHWEANSEHDLQRYAIYRSSNKLNEPDSLEVYAFTTDTSFIDSNPMIDLEAYYYVKAQDIHENFSKMSNQITLRATNIIGNNNDIPTEYSLNQNYPNPFNPSTQIEFSIPQNSHITLKVFNVLGKEVATLINGERETGSYSLTWNAQNCPSGVYFYRLTAGSYTMTKKLVLMR
jgi:hypothetical protein